MHSGAVMKAYHNRFAFRAPPKGSGQLSFHCLLKMGGANYGYFVWPNNKDLKLTEGSTKATKWVKSGIGKSCKTACRQAEMECDQTKLSKVNSKSSFEAQLSRDFSCKLPLVAGCSRGAPAEAADGLCEYHSTDSSCKASRCIDKADGESRFCPCIATALNEDEWSEMRQESPSTGLMQNPRDSSNASKCESFFTQDKCVANGCFFEGEEGMAICSETKGPVAN